MGKARSYRTPNRGYSRAQSLGWCFTKKLCMRRDAWAGMLSWWSCQSPVAHSCSLLNHPNSFRGGMFKLNTKSDADFLLYSLSHFWMQWPHSTRAHSMASTTSADSTVKLSLFIYAHSSPLSLAARLHWCSINHSHCINNGWTFPNRPRIEYYSVLKRMDIPTPVTSWMNFEGTMLSEINQSQKNKYYMTPITRYLG